MSHDERIVRNPGVCGGEAVFLGTRVTLRTVLASLAAGDSIEKILADFPALKAEDVRAAIAFAAASAGEDLPVPATPPVRWESSWTKNLPARLSAVLSGLHHDVHTLSDENLSGCSDHELWEASKREGRFLITQDLDFSDLRQFTPGTHHGILLVRLRTPDRESLINRVQELFRTEDVNSWARCFVVATERKVRVVRPLHQGEESN
jgi:uncharacterized protein (DUF433 family)/predicted nuclease of predicted toxin-antitoxin system